MDTGKYPRETTTDTILVIDVEATCWVDKKPPPGEEADIIEIGLCVLDVNAGELFGKRSIIVRPERSTMSEFCEELTNLSREQVENGLLFADACALLEREYKTKNIAWASWGDYDRKMFASQCEAYSVPYPFSEKHINAKQLFGTLHGNKRFSIQGGMRIAAIPFKGDEQRGDEDAWHVGTLLNYMLQSFGRDMLRLT